MLTGYPMRILLLLLCLIAHRAVADVSVNVPLDHWAYEFIDRFKAKGVLTPVGDGIRPFSRVEMGRMIETVARREDLSPIERAEVGILEEEFAEELHARHGLGTRMHGLDRRDAGSLWSRARRGHPLVRLEEEGLTVHLDPFVRQIVAFLPEEHILHTDLGCVVRGQFRERVGFRIGFRETREQGTRVYRSREDLFERRIEYVKIKGDSTLVDGREGTAYLTFRLPWVRVEVGKDFVDWGPGWTGNLGLSDNAPSFDQVKLSAKYGRLKIVGLMGELRSMETDSLRSYLVNGNFRGLDRSKYLSGHRLEFEVHPDLKVGFQEVVLYGDRGPKLIYLNPVMLYLAAETYLDDKDNVSMGLDIDARPMRNLRAYLALFIDDMRKFKLGKGAFANKLGVQVGALWVDPLGLRDTDLRIEYVRIEPWVYTHKYSINSYLHYGALLGHPIGPNADLVQAQIEHRLSGALSVRLFAGSTRHGRNEVLPDGTVRNVGGDATLGYRQGDNKETKRFLDGVLERRQEFGMNVRYRPLPRLHLGVNCRQIRSHNVLKSDGSSGDSTDTEMVFSVQYSYF